ncbi:MAG: MFS transporter [Bacteroidia bacterium]|nr:MFS transporter [Bacteroidia bacterium]
MPSSSSVRAALIILISMFFFWGFVASANDVLIPLFKEKLRLTQWQSQLISFVFYVSYTSGTIFYILISGLIHQDILQKIGFRNGMALGLLISFMGTLFFIPASAFTSFVWMLAGLYIIGLGFSLMQTVANTLVICLGNPEKSSQRLSLAGGINNIGSTLGPLVLGYFLFSDQQKPDIEFLYIPYLIMGLAFLLMAWWFRQSSVPEHLDHENVNHSIRWNELFKNKKVIFSMIAIFVYVGTEVSTVSNFPELLKSEYRIKVSHIPAWISLYWAGLMMGRWADASKALFINPLWQNVFKSILPFMAFGFYCFVHMLSGQNFDDQLYFVFFIPLFIVLDFLSKGNPNKQLVYYSLGGGLSLLIMMFLKSHVGLYCVIMAGMFCSTLWPCIFSVALRGESKNASSISVGLIMMIMGGGILSLLQGWLSSEDILGIRFSYIVGFICFLYLAWYGKKYTLATNS